MAQLSNLIVNGVTRLLSKVYVSDSVTAPTFIGKLQGNADTATNLSSTSTITLVPSGSSYRYVCIAEITVVDASKILNDDKCTTVSFDIMDDYAGNVHKMSLYFNATSTGTIDADTIGHELFGHTSTITRYPYYYNATSSSIKIYRKFDYSLTHLKIANMMYFSDAIKVTSPSSIITSLPDGSIELAPSADFSKLARNLLMVTEFDSATGTLRTQSTN